MNALPIFKQTISPGRPSQTPSSWAYHHMSQTLNCMLSEAESQRRNTTEEHLDPSYHGEALPNHAVHDDDAFAESRLLPDMQLEEDP